MTSDLHFSRSVLLGAAFAAGTFSLAASTAWADEPLVGEAVEAVDSAVADSAADTVTEAAEAAGDAVEDVAESAVGQAEAAVDSATAAVESATEEHAETVDEVHGEAADGAHGETVDEAHGEALAGDHADEGDHEHGDAAAIAAVVFSDIEVHETGPMTMVGLSMETSYDGMATDVDPAIEKLFANLPPAVYAEGSPPLYFVYDRMTENPDEPFQLMIGVMMEEVPDDLSDELSVHEMESTTVASLSFTGPAGAVEPAYGLLLGEGMPEGMMSTGHHAEAYVKWVSEESPENEIQVFVEVVPVEDAATEEAAAGEGVAAVTEEIACAEGCECAHCVSVEHADKLGD